MTTRYTIESRLPGGKWKTHHFWTTIRPNRPAALEEVRIFRGLYPHRRWRVRARGLK